MSLFLDKLHNTNKRQHPEITSFFVHRSVYFAFLGKPARIFNHGTTHSQRQSSKQEMLEGGAEEETQEFTQQSKQRKERNRQIEQERQADEERLAQLAEQRQAEERRLVQIAKQRQAKEGQLFQLAQLAEERQREAEEKRNWITERERQWQAEEEERRQTEEDLFEEAEEEKRRQVEEYLFEKDDIQETRTSKGQKYLAKAEPDRGSLVSLWNTDGGGGLHRKKTKTPRGIGATRREKDRKRTTQVDLGEVIEPVTQGQTGKDQGELGIKPFTSLNNANSIVIDAANSATPYPEEVIKPVTQGRTETDQGELGM